LERDPSPGSLRSPPSPLGEGYSLVYFLPSPLGEGYSLVYFLPSPLGEGYTLAYFLPSPLGEGYALAYLLPSPLGRGCVAGATQVRGCFARSHWSRAGNGGRFECTREEAIGEQRILRLGSVKDAAQFLEHLDSLGLALPFESELARGDASPLAWPLARGGLKIGNRIAVHPMEGWDGTADGNPTESTLRRWRRFGRSGAKLIWGGEAVAVRHDGRANPNQLMVAPHTRGGLARLRSALIEEHRQATGGDEGLLVGLQLTHSGRYAKPNARDRHEPRILYHHPILDKRLGLPGDYPLLTDGEVRGIIEDFHRAARAAAELGFDFVDIKHCHGYLGHEFLSAHTREGDYGGSFENRTRFLSEVVEGIRSGAPGLRIGVRFSAYDSIPYRPDPALSSRGQPGPGIPEAYEELIPYRWGFGVNARNPTLPDLSETYQFLELLQKLDITLVNITAGSPYYCPHVQRPAIFPPSDGYQPPCDPLVGVAQMLEATRQLKERFPNLIMVGTGYTYLQDFLPNVAQAAVREGWVDSVGLGRMVLTYPEQLRDIVQGAPIQHKRICRTFSDCTTAPRNGLPSGCYPLDAYYKESENAGRLREIKKRI
jgi:2,4-dienoyl-CoA reductase-like NADH-dependent reductase (Old Yellow Enzyme family)